MSSKMHTRARIRLNNQTDVINFIQELTKFEDRYTIENMSGDHRVNAKSVIGVMYTMCDFPDDMYLVNDSHDGYIPAVLDKYRIV